MELEESSIPATWNDPRRRECVLAYRPLTFRSVLQTKVVLRDLSLDVGNSTAQTPK